MVVRISDRAGGMPSRAASEVWSYLYTTSTEASATERPAREPRPWGVDQGESPMAGRGVGLPLCRLYAMYLRRELAPHEHAGPRHESIRSARLL